MNKAEFIVDENTKSMVVKRTFNAPKDAVWEAWTNSEILDKWWAPRPWKAVTERMEFTPGGEWFYYMAGPEGEKHYCLVQYKEINAQDDFRATDAFCDETGKVTDNSSVNHWHNQFFADGENTNIVVTVTFESLEGMKQLTEMGMKEGFAMGMDQLEELLQQ